MIFQGIIFGPFFLMNLCHIDMSVHKVWFLNKIKFRIYFVTFSVKLCFLTIAYITNSTAGTLQYLNKCIAIFCGGNIVTETRVRITIFFLGQASIGEVSKMVSKLWEQLGTEEKQVCVLEFLIFSVFEMFCSSRLFAVVNIKLTIEEVFLQSSVTLLHSQSTYTDILIIVSFKI